MVQGKWYPMGADLAVPMQIRQTVFGRGRDPLDDMAQQVVVFRGDEPAGTARLWWQDGAFVLGDVCVLPPLRHQGFGDLLVRLLLFKALTHSATEIRLNAPADVAGFFAAYGFHGQKEQNGMVPMFIRADEIHLSHCGGHCDGCK